MGKYISARAALVGVAAIALAGCGSAASTSAASGGSPTESSSATASASAVSSATASPSGAAATGDSAPFPVAVGNTWVYQVVASINNAHGLDTKKVLDVTPVPGGNRVTMSDSIGPGTPVATQEHYLFFANGQLGFPVNEAHGVSVVSGNGVIWPDAAGVASGRAYHSVLQIKLAGGQSETANVTVQGGGTESVTVPAGTIANVLAQSPGGLVRLSWRIASGRPHCARSRSSI